METEICPKEASEGQKRTGRQPLTQRGGPERDGEPFVEENWLNTDTLCSEATALMKHTADEAVVKEKMKQTFIYRQKMVHDPVKSSDIFTTFPRFLDIAGLIEQDFSLMFGDAISASFLEKWPTVYKRKVLQQSRGLTQAAELQDLVQNAESTEEVENESLENLCHNCGAQDTDDPQWIACDICGRWYHHTRVSSPLLHEAYLCAVCKID
ncbi:uncharacterized protein LOC115435867 [Sphaeramia orbicularis]|uniref:uncharacterized protein LOC115435867 n=1 Tax=Sphaeramia orbicularis TaxID=375764 RepID=UPI00117BFDFB|nr:uncharacterized protein LOC115435867 [Sphaeramia orbicularis]XP_030014337.1 uncharacterized protein LOC115435867 [Sphaeramia orbicularis]XP_030014338.1 uncharacterized protein LOC115435867 [Sphaeramia orbicularis]XP_030014339.1 uncharacterized protein LOC115435867 [Sphaeramia orbicularis]